MTTARSSKPEISGETVWQCLLAVRRLTRETEEPAALEQLGFDGRQLRIGTAGTVLTLWRDGKAWRWRSPHPVSADGEALFDLYLPLCTSVFAGRHVIGHLGQSLDGRIATETGVSQFITGPENILHMHRLRALADVVVVGAGTIASDDPRLTTREVEGPNPVRVIIDPDGRLPADHRVFRDAAAPTLICRAAAGEMPSGGPDSGVIGVPLENGRLSTGAILDALEARGFRLVFIEGGGVTVSRFLEAGTLDRLQLTVAPVLLGSGRAAVSLPPIETLEQALRPAVRRIPMGRDMLFDCDLRAE